MTDWRDEARLYARLRPFARRVDSARRWIGRALAVDARWSVSFSGGKDSTVMLDLVLEQKPDIALVWFDDGWDYPETLQFLSDTERRLGRRINHVLKPVSADFWRDEVRYGGDDPTREHRGDIELADLAATFDGAFIGLRAEESSARCLNLRRRGGLYYAQADRQWHACPLWDWTTRDVWAYLIGRDVPYNAVYDRLAVLGVPLEYRRVGPLTAWQVWQYGSMATLKRGWPELFNRFAVEFPEVRSYT